MYLAFNLERLVFMKRLMVFRKHRWLSITRTYSKSTSRASYNFLTAEVFFPSNLIMLNSKIWETRLLIASSHVFFHVHPPSMSPPSFTCKVFGCHLLVLLFMAAASYSVRLCYQVVQSNTIIPWGGFRRLHPRILV